METPVRLEGDFPVAAPIYSLEQAEAAFAVYMDDCRAAVRGGLSLISAFRWPIVVPVGTQAERPLENRTMIKGLAHVCIAATDLAATERFYCSGLGFMKLFDFVRNGEVVGFYLKVDEGTYVEAFRQDTVDAQAPSPISHLCFEVDDIDAVSRRLAALGCPVTEKMLGADQSWQIWTTDPAGVRIEFHQYTAESCQKTGKACILD